MAETINFQLSLTAEEFGALAAAVAFAADAAKSSQERAWLEAAEDRVRSAMRQALGPMSVGAGMQLTRAIQATERAVNEALSR